MTNTAAVATRPPRRLRLVATYLGLVGIPALLALGVLRVGTTLPAASGVAATQSTAGATTFDLALFILQIVVIVTVARLVGWAFRRIGQPRVIGEMIAGLVLGPSVLGWLAPTLSAALFPPATLGYVNALAQVGLLLFMFLVGLDFDFAHLKNRGRAALLTSHASIVAPFLLGSALALPLYGRFAPAGIRFVPFALFVGAAMSVTAFPVLARILADRKLTNTPLGAIAIACAAVGDVTAWCILAGVVVVARTGSIVSLAITIGGTLAYIAGMLTLGRALLTRLAARATTSHESIEGFLAVMCVVILGSAWITEKLGVHALFGAFAVGALLPRNGPVIDALRGRLRDVMVVLLLPLFFVLTGLRTTVALISGGRMWATCLLVLLVAIVGKLGGSAIGARASGMSWRDALSLGALMNTRGLIELVILNVGLEIGILTPTLFTMLVIMAIVTTVLTTPLLDLLRRGQSPAVGDAG